MKTSWVEKLVIWFWGIRGVYDEHARAEFGRAATVGITVLVALELIYSIVMMAFPHSLGDLWPLINVLLLIGVLLYVGSALKKAGLTVIEVTRAEYQDELLKLRKRVAILAVFVIVIMALTTMATEYARDGQIFSSQTLVPIIVFAVVFTPMAYARARADIHIVKND